MLGMGVVVALALAITPEENPWEHINTPSEGPSRSIGNYGSGCLEGGKALPFEGPGYYVIRPSRQKNFGHSHLISFVKKLAFTLKMTGNGDILIGDLGSSRGGPIVGWHASHQIGLDGDIWFVQPPRGKYLTRKEREVFDPVSMLNADQTQVTHHWNKHKEMMVKYAAQSSRLNRIFINPTLKRKLCESYGGEPWLQKVRPWWGHHAHFHVRLSCPSNSPQCVSQAPLPPGDGCDSIGDWQAQAGLYEPLVKMPPPHCEFLLP